MQHIQPVQLRSYAAGLFAGTAVAWVDTPLMALARFKQLFPHHSYAEHARGIYASRGALGFWAAGNGLHSWGRPNMLPGSQATVGMLCWSSCQGVVVWGVYHWLRRYAAPEWAVRPQTTTETGAALCGAAICGGVAGGVGSVFSLPRDLLVNLCIADEARSLEHARLHRTLSTQMLATPKEWGKIKEAGAGGWLWRWRQHQKGGGGGVSMLGWWMRESLARVLVGGRSLGSQREALVAVLGVSGSAAAGPSGRVPPPPLSSSSAAGAWGFMRSDGARLLMRGWELHICGAVLFHASGFAACEIALLSHHSSDSGGGSGSQGGGQASGGPLLHTGLSLGQTTGAILCCGLGALAACPFEAAKVRAHAQLRPLPVDAGKLKTWVAKAMQQSSWLSLPTPAARSEPGCPSGGDRGITALRSRVAAVRAALADVAGGAAATPGALHLHGASTDIGASGRACGGDRMQQQQQQSARWSGWGSSGNHSSVRDWWTGWRAGRGGVVGPTPATADAQAGSIKAHAQRVMGGAQSLLHGGAMTVVRAVVYHVILGLGYEVAMRGLSAATGS